MDNQPTPMSVQQTTVIQVGSQKSVAGAVLLALFFGPLGMIYATVVGALVMFVISILVAIATLGLGLLITTPICAIWAGVAASNHNKRLGISSQQAAFAGQAAPAGWHQDPDGSGRLRYYDGIRWTGHYAHHAPGPEAAAPAPEPPPAPQLEEEAAPVASEDEGAEADGEEQADDSEAVTTIADAEAPPEPTTETEAEKAYCGACGAGVSPAARFCSACGETQALA